MAEGNTLKYTCKDATGGTMTKSFGNVDAEVADANAQALGTALVTNGAIFANPPVSVEKIVLVKTEEKEIDVA